MNTRSRAPWARLAAASAMLVILGWTWMSPFSAWAQTGGSVTIPGGGSLIVTVTSPTAGSIVTGAITVSASVSSGLTVQSVQFKLDGVDLGAPDTAAPYAISWDTRTTTNAPHTLTAVAKDVLDNWKLLERAWVKIMPQDFKRVLAEREEKHASSVRDMILSPDGGTPMETGTGIEGVPDHG